jgi:hypothetical protein
MHPEQSGGEPPLDRPTQSGTATPAVGIATTLAVAGIVDTLEHTPAHHVESRSLEAQNQHDEALASRT